jgi:hypothetical protein
MTWHAVFKTLSTENKERILICAREKCQTTYTSKPVRKILDFSTNILKARKTWNRLF